MTFRITTPASYQPEQQYIIRCIFEHFWGQEVIFSTADVRNSYIYNDQEGQGKYIEVVNSLFLTPQEQWLTSASLPDEPLEKRTVPKPFADPLIHDTLPVIYGDSQKRGELISQNKNGWKINIDVFGSAFFMLTRYEEVVKKQRDAIGRFPGKASLAMKQGFIKRPIINEYIEILWTTIKQVWPKATRREKVFSTDVSHDVDAPFKYADFNFLQMGKRVVKSGVRGGINSAFTEAKNWWKVNNYGIEHDPYNTFELIMDISERNNCRSAFYFISDHTNKNRDGHYHINQPSIKNILKKIHDRGHEIGLHPSYNTYNNGEQLRKEFEKLRETCVELSIEQSEWGGRQHYLRWENPQTFQHWEDAGLNYDSTLTFASQPGFRCGICYPYPVFNLETKQQLQLIERPLIVMEASVLDSRYLGLSEKKARAYDLMTMLKERCKKFNGNFVILWHNNRFVDAEEVELYQQVLKY